MKAGRIWAHKPDVASELVSYIFIGEAHSTDPGI